MPGNKAENRGGRPTGGTQFLDEMWSDRLARLKVVAERRAYSGAIP